LSAQEIARALPLFRGLPHRMERVAVLSGIAFINDSKATNADAAAGALAAYAHIYWIAGGVAKAGGIESLSPLFPRIRRAFLIGEAQESFARTLEAQNVPYTRCGTLDNALGSAYALARAECVGGAAVLLSPACASFDQFTSFEHRGDVFRGLVRGMEEAHVA
jgi:UDP-N-acetylmuramoylalanine--D-glutamate ligase